MLGPGGVIILKMDILFIFHSANRLPESHHPGNKIKGARNQHPSAPKTSILNNRLAINLTKHDVQRPYN